MYSIRTLAKQWSVSRKTAEHRVRKEGWSKVDPVDVGSMKTSVNVWKVAGVASKP